jgi:hypothetical protein
MQITDKQLSAIEYALQLAEYFCDEHDSGFHPEQSESDWKTYNNAMKALKEIKESEKVNA